MTAEQFDIIRAIIKSAYPSFNIMPDKYSIKLWYTMLGDLDYSLCETALQELIATHTYPPQISEIRAKCAEYTAPQLKDAGEAWEDVQKAIQKYGYYRSDEAMESLSGPTKQAVERIGFRELCYGDNPVHYVEDRVAKADSEGFNRGKASARKGTGVKEFIDYIKSAKIPGVGAVTISKLIKVADENGYI